MAQAHGPDFVTNWLHRDAYSLPQLGEVIPMGWRRPAVSRTGVGRNCDLFESLIRWAGCPENTGNDCLAAAHVINQSFEVPLPHSEIAATARSVHRYRARWIAKGKFYTPEQKTLWGRERQARGAANRRKRKNLDDRDRLIVQAVAEGQSMRSVAGRFALSRMQVWRISQSAK